MYVEQYHLGYTIKQDVRIVPLDVSDLRINRLMDISQQWNPYNGTASLPNKCAHVQNSWRRCK